MTEDRVDTDVLIIGGGPVGLAMSVALGRLGIRSLLVERRRTTSEHPKATVVNVRSTELIRGWGLEEEMRSRALPLERSGFVSWHTRLAGHEIGALALIDEDPTEFQRRLAQSPTLPCICPQSEVEQVLLDAARSFASSDVRFGLTLDGFKQDSDSVTATCIGADGERVQAVARYMVAADGPQGMVRRRLGIENAGLEGLGQMVNIHFEAGLDRYTNERASVLYWIINADLRGVIHALDGRRRWLLNVVVMPEEEVESFGPERCAALVREAVGETGLEVTVLSVKPWTLCCVVAESYRSDRVFLVGDAAHQFPPTGGFGMNTGIQDAHNLAWKLAAVIDGRASASLLDTYDEERRPIAEHNAEQSVLNAQRMAATGLFVDPDGELGARVEEDGAEGERLRADLAEAVPAQREHFIFDGQDLGFRYSSLGVIADGSDPLPNDDPIGTYVPDAQPGARAPHLWLVDGAGEELSILDLFERDLVLLAAAGGADWCAAAETVGSQSARSLLLAFRIAEDGDFRDPADEFANLYRIGPAGAVLVRPDGHVAARFRGQVEDPVQALAAALTELGWRLPAGAGVAG